MTTNFDPAMLGQRPAAGGRQATRSERLFVVVEDYETPKDGFHYAVGHRVDAPEQQVRVRLTTVNERAQDRPNDDIDKIRTVYETGENTREQIADKARAGITLLSFDDARRVGEADGVTEYRAHWPKTMATVPEAEVMGGMAHIRLRPGQKVGNEQKPAQAYVELLKSSTIASPDNIDQVLTDALAIKDDQGRARDPIAIVRVLHEGKVYAQPRMYPATVTSQKFDQATGENRSFQSPLEAVESLQSLMSGRPGRNDFETRQLDTMRALVAGIKGLDYPKVNTPDPEIQDGIRNLYYGAKGGHLQLEVIAGEKIDFGADSRKTYLSERERPHLAAYVVRETLEREQVKETPGYANTVLAVMRHPDGEPYAVFASPAPMYPKAKKLTELAVEETNRFALAGEVAKPLREQPQLAREMDDPEPAPF